MISIRLDEGGAPSVLAALADARLQKKLAKVAAEEYVSAIHDWLNAGRGFTPRSPGGGLEQAINWRPLPDGAEVYAAKTYARFVEFGTRAHVIGPKPGRKGLKIPVAGVSSPVGPQLPGRGYILRRAVKHPGSRPYPYFFADRQARSERLQRKCLSVLATLAQGGSRG